jgi:hypothetical protein
MESWCLEMIKECLVYSSKCLGVPFIAPRQLGAVGGNLGRQFLPSVGWRTGQSGAPPDSHCSMSGADRLPKIAQPTVADLEPLAHRTLSGAHRSVQCRPPADRWSGPRVARGFGSRLLRWRPLAHRTVRWIIVVRRRRIPESGKFARAQPGAPDTIWCTTGQSGVPDCAESWLLQPSHFLSLFSLILALRQIY